MDTSIFLAKLIGIIYLILGIGIIINTRYYHKMFDDLLNDTPLIYISGLLALVTGFLLITFHNIWVGSWVVIITIFGWLAFIKGILLLAFPKVMRKISKSLFKTSNAFFVDGLIIIVLGLVFAYFGYLA